MYVNVPWSVKLSEEEALQGMIERLSARGSQELTVLVLAINKLPDVVPTSDSPAAHQEAFRPSRNEATEALLTLLDTMESISHLRQTLKTVGDKPRPSLATIT